ncbi:molybdate ABC transporter substrate-binding protein [Sulfitobacter sp.]|uniref:molybdate ABC transporter substrate-binding protein n=1 Tax=Sulfitobacter sp. TaxID=1903071 RepID=UPI003001ECEC
MTARLLSAVTTCLLSLWAMSAPVRAADIPIIAAASDLQFAVTEIAATFEAQTGYAVRLNFGSTGNFARQIREGAPFDVFMAADESYVLDLAQDRLTRDDGFVYAEGRIVLIAPHGSALSVDDGMNGLADALAQRRITRFAIANPDHAPYGVRAMEALKHRQLWEPLQPMLVLGENVSQAAQFATTGNAEGGIIAYSLALAPQVSALGTYALIPADWHAPLRQRMVLLKDAGPEAEAFYTFMNSPQARTIMETYGFKRPEE